MVARGRQAAQQQLAGLPLNIFEAHKNGPKHGFHSGHIAVGEIRKELDQVPLPLTSAARPLPRI